MATTNLHSIDNIEINGMDFKHLETTKDIVITSKNEYGRPAWPDTTHKWTAKVSDGTNYVGDYAVKINTTNMIIDSEDFTKLPVGNYQLEVWEQWTDADGASQLSIYPSPQQTIPFHIYANIPDQAAHEIKEIGFQDVVDQAVMNIGMNYVFKVNIVGPDDTATVVQAASDGKNYVTFNIPQGKTGEQGFRGPAPTLHVTKVTSLPSNEAPTFDLVPVSDGNYNIEVGIPKGDKGDTGTVDNAGLTNAPAFQALQAQVNDSAVGTNLLTGTSGDLQTKQFTNVWNSGPQATNGNYQIKLAKGQTYTYRAWIDNTNGPDLAYVYVRFSTTTDASTSIGLANGTPIDNGKTGYSTALITPPEDGYAWFTPFAYDSLETFLAGWKEEKLEVGSVATDWCPNPAEILTQADYAKIKAAIVALGGSLS